MKELNEKQKQFCHYYVEFGNRQKAYNLAYKKEGISSYANDLFNKEYIQQYIKSLTEERNDEMIAKSDEVLMFYTSVMRNESLPTSERLKAADSLAKRYGLFTQKIDIKTEVNGNFEINILGDEGEGL